ncbi:hypothetical protein HIM_08127 [Hirsutella minnesotensis 3608]|uniref:Tetratricopeptide SHNi-TPR domain-containing protein n=1 Tax=Hirsutella minnesotensis 3608 TaxID=1043627 RepID=A0A0F7ZT42_9HYPO|nr:hypothetical protein HIM_08127 [Hirsutella minnesotensis 3608]
MADSVVEKTRPDAAVDNGENVDANQAAPASEAVPIEAEAVDAEVVDVEADHDIKSRKVSLADLSAKGATLYAQRKYEGASDIFSKASVLQAEMNGETAPENAEILFHYGRSLFKVGQSKSDVLGGTAAEKQPAKANGSSKEPAAGALDESASAVAAKAKQAGAEDVKESKAEGTTGVAGDAKKPLFQFTGDENFDQSDEEDEEGADEEGQEEEDDDLATSFEILDLARVCYLKQLEKLTEEEQAGKGKEVAQQDSPAVRHIKERLADTHDCLAEISLENERYPSAIEDGRVSLKYKVELYPEDSEIVAEAHYKLSLALEFASITESADDGTNAKRAAVDQDLRDEAVREMELAIKSFKLKMQGKEVDLATMASPEDNDAVRMAINEMKEVVADMEQRLVDLRKDPIDTSALPGAELLGGILGTALGQSPAAAEALVAEAAKNATDLTGLVRKKKAKDADADADAAAGSKRKADELAPLAAVDNDTGSASPKKPRLDDAAEQA